MRAILIPAAPNQPLLDLQVPQHIHWTCVTQHDRRWMTRAVWAWVLDLVEGTPGSPLFSITFSGSGCSSATLFWIAHLQLHVNERAAQMAGVPDVRGDALVVSEYAEHSTASELCGSETCQISGNGHSCGPHDVTVRSPTGNVSFRIDTFRHGACLQEIRSKEKKIHDTNSNCGAPTLGAQQEVEHIDRGKEGGCSGQCCVIRPKNQHRVLSKHKYDSTKVRFAQSHFLKRQPSLRVYGRAGSRVSPRTILNLQKKLREANVVHVADVPDANEVQHGAEGSTGDVSDKKVLHRIGVLELDDVLSTSNMPDTAHSINPAAGKVCHEEFELAGVAGTVFASVVPKEEPENFTDTKRLKLDLPMRIEVEECSQRDIECLPQGLLQTIFGFLSFTDLSSCAAVCHQWRQCIAEDQVTLAALPLRYRPLASHLKAPPRAHLGCSRAEQRIPFVLKCAAEAGNLSGIVLIAQELDIRGEKGKALSWYKQAARKGHQLSQYKLGESYYRGTQSWQRDCSEALKWLQKAAKHPTPEPSIRGAAAMMLGYMYLDGEGLDGADNSEAVKWFKIARSHGNLEAEKTVGWLWNTGQY